MSRAYSWDLRQRIVDAITQGETRRAATAASKFRPPRLFGSSSGQIERVQSSRSGGGGKLGPYQNAIIAKVEAQPDITMPDLATWLEEHHGVKADPSNLSKLLCRAGHTQTFIAGLRCDAITAPFVVDGAMDGDKFDTYVRTQLTPTLEPGDVVIWDNLNVKKAPERPLPSPKERLGYSSCRDIRQTTIRSKWPFPSSRHCCEK